MRSGPVILTDPHDNVVLAAAAGVGIAEAIVQGDAHLLGIGESGGLP